MTVISFRVPVVPVAQPRHRIGVVAGKARAFEAKKTHPIHSFKATVRMAVRGAYNGPPLQGPLELDACFIMPRPKAKTWKRRPMLREWINKRPDLDNLAKGAMDALGGLLWTDDSQVARLVTEKHLASGVEQPHVIIKVRCLEGEPREW